MNTRANLWELKYAVEDAADLLERASQMALEISGYEAGRQADPEHGCPEQPEVEGWPAMVKLCDLLGGLATAVKAAVPPEIQAAIKEEHDRDADYESPEAMGLGPR